MSQGVLVPSARMDIFIMDKLWLAQKTQMYGQRAEGIDGYPPQPAASQLQAAESTPLSRRPVPATPIYISPTSSGSFFTKEVTFHASLTSLNSYGPVHQGLCLCPCPPPKTLHPTLMTKAPGQQSPWDHWDHHDKVAIHRGSLLASQNQVI